MNEAPVLAGDFNVIPTDLDVYAPERWRDDALFRPEVRSAYQRLLNDGWIDAIRTLHPEDASIPFGNTCATRMPATRGFVSTICS